MGECPPTLAGAVGESELFAWPSAQLFLVNDEERALLQSGAFTLLLAHGHNLSRSAHLVLVEASVGDVRWPVGKDCRVTSFAAQPSCFLFALCMPTPSSGDWQLLTYQLLLHHDPSSSAILQICRLQTLLTLYSTLHLQASTKTPSNPGPAKGAALKELEEAAKTYWTARTHETNPAKQWVSDKELKVSAGYPQADCSSSDGSPTSSPAAPGGVSRRMMKKMQKARRISAVSKLISKAVVRGLIRAKEHVVQEGGRGSRTSDQQSSRHGSLIHRDQPAAVANVDAVTRVVEAVEGNGVQCVAAGKTCRADGLDQNGSSSLPTWTLNEPGLRLVLNVAMVANNAQQAGAPRKAVVVGSAPSSCLTAASMAKPVVSGSPMPPPSSATLHMHALSPSSSSSSSPRLSSRRPPRPPLHRPLTEAPCPALVINSSPTLT